MSRTQKLFLILFSLSGNPLSGQSVSTLMGAPAAGMGYASATLKDEWSLVNNPGGMTAVKSPSAAFACEASNLPGANRIAGLFSCPLKTGVAGLALFRFGDEIYNEQIVSSGYSNQFGIASLGIALNYIQYNAVGFGSRAAVSLNFGGIAQLTSQLRVGAYIINLTQPKLSTTGSEKLPTKMAAGLSFKPADHITLAAEIAKDLEYNAVVKAGIEYQVKQKVNFRTGFNFSPGAAFFGVGFGSRNVRFDYAFQYASFIGAAHQASAVYQFQKTQSHRK